MHAQETARVRNVALLGHAGSGKTTIAEAILHLAGVIPRQGAVDSGNTAMDHEPEEIQRGSSVSLAVASFDWSASDNALDTIAAVRKALGRDLPAVLITADPTPELQARLTAIGIPLLRKPLKAAALRSLLTHFTGAQRTAAE